MPKWSDFVSWAFFGLIAYFGYQLTTSVEKMSDSVQELNVKMAVMVERDNRQELDLEKLGTRVEKLEGRRVR